MHYILSKKTLKCLLSWYFGYKPLSKLECLRRCHTIITYTIPIRKNVNLKKELGKLMPQPPFSGSICSCLGFCIIPPITSLYWVKASEAPPTLRTLQKVLNPWDPLSPLKKPTFGKYWKSSWKLVIFKKVSFLGGQRGGTHDF